MIHRYKTNLLTEAKPSRLSFSSSDANHSRVKRIFSFESCKQKPSPEGHLSWARCNLSGSSTRGRVQCRSLSHSKNTVCPFTTTKEAARVITILSSKRDSQRFSKKHLMNKIISLCRKTWDSTGRASEPDHLTKWSKVKHLRSETVCQTLWKEKTPLYNLGWTLFKASGQPHHKSWSWNTESRLRLSKGHNKVLSSNSTSWLNSNRSKGKVLCGRGQMKFRLNYSKLMTRTSIKAKLSMIKSQKLLASAKLAFRWLCQVRGDFQAL